jgi:hypothetical protein
MLIYSAELAGCGIIISYVFSRLFGSCREVVVAVVAIAGYSVLLR